MTTPRHSLAYQVAAIRHVIADYETRSDPSDTILEAARDALRTLTLVERHQHSVRDVIRMEQKHPILRAIRENFEGAELVAVRSNSDASNEMHEYLCASCGAAED